jgi:hypothetical protein
MYNNVYQMTPSVRDTEWYKDFQMGYNTFILLCNILGPYIMRADTNYRKVLRVDKAVGMILYKLAFGHSDRIIGQKFAQGRSTIQRYNLIICRVFADKKLLFSRYISIPTGQRLHSVIERFHALSRLPNMCGAIDGTHIKLYQKPAQCYIPADYWSRHDFHSVLSQGICDGDRNFWNICIAAPGGTHDATHLRQSTFYKSLV